jgi:hypothetical protein
MHLTKIYAYCVGYWNHWGINIQPGVNVMKKSCEGNCIIHVGKVKRVRVEDHATGNDWGVFYYCQKAIDTDRGYGLTVTKIKKGDFNDEISKGD